VARDRANIKSTLQADEHWRSLTHHAQWLYKYLLVSPTLNLCGVADWRPARIAAAARGVVVEDVEVWAEELSSEFFVVIDEATEEVLIRSFFRHDGILAPPVSSQRWLHLGFVGSSRMSFDGCVRSSRRGSGSRTFGSVCRSWKGF